MSDSISPTDDQVLRAADGTPLRQKLSQALFRSRVRAVALVLPLLLFIFITFLFPIAALLWQGVKSDTYERFMPNSTELLRAWDGVSDPTEEMAAAVVADLVLVQASKDTGKVATRVNREYGGATSTFKSTARSAKRMEAPFLEALHDKNKRWKDIELWQGMKLASQTYTPAFLAAAVDMQYNADGSFEQAEELYQIHIKLFIRTLWISAAVVLFTFILGYPLAYFLATLPLKYSNLLMIAVLLPFWTSLLVRTTAWIAILQGQGVINSLLVWIGIIGDDGRLSMIYNQTGTLIAMTHILLPFMVLPLYSVMRGISPSYMRAARSLGGNDAYSFFRVYFPLSLPGIGAGGLLVFILAIGYYITPALVGGKDGQLISNVIAFHMQRSLNWSLAAALSIFLLGGTLIMYAIYNRFVGIDKLKLG